MTMSSLSVVSKLVLALTTSFALPAAANDAYPAPRVVGREVPARRGASPAERPGAARMRRTHVDLWQSCERRKIRIAQSLQNNNRDAFGLSRRVSFHKSVG